MSEGIPFICEYCGRPTTITEPNHDNSQVYISCATSEHGRFIGLRTGVVVCPHPNCSKLHLKVGLVKFQWDGAGNWKDIETVQTFHCLPDSTAKPQPDYIPAPLREDYYEAARIKVLSPKASATLSRRCLQGMIRDFWGVTGERDLFHEILAIEDKVDPQTWSAIDAVRNLGNIGAHMERDINVIVEVDPDEAQILIELNETLFRDWYVARHERKERMEALVRAAAEKKEQRKGVAGADANNPGAPE